MSDEAAMTKPASMDGPPPTLYLRDDQIGEYTDLDFGTAQIGDTVDMSIRLKVVSKTERKEPEYGEKGEEEGMKTHRSIDLELVGKDKKRSIDKAKGKMQESGGGMA